MKPIRHFSPVPSPLLALAGCNKKQGKTATQRRRSRSRRSTPPPGGDWTDVVNATAAGGFMMGNPNAKVKLVEIGSLTCPHCREFDEKGVPTAGRQICEVGPGQLGVPHLCARRLRHPGRADRPLQRREELLPAGPRDVQGPAGVGRQDPGGRRRRKLDSCRTCRRTSNSSSHGEARWGCRNGPRPAASRRPRATSASATRAGSTSWSSCPATSTQFPDFSGTPTFVINGTMLKDGAPGTSSSRSSTRR